MVVGGDGYLFGSGGWWCLNLMRMLVGGGRFILGGWWGYFGLWWVVVGLFWVIVGGGGYFWVVVGGGMVYNNPFCVNEVFK